jgi:nitrate/TMAO reductase-like tetraheme cytochrome c subunit
MSPETKNQSTKKDGREGKNIIRINFLPFLAGLFIAAIAGVIGFEALHYTATPEFCMSCHEMRVVGEQGWMRSPHYRNQYGVVAECGDCHIPPETELARMLWVKTRDGSWDIYTHLFGESEPRGMDWDKLSVSARSKIHDSSCVKCHSNLTARGVPMKAIIAHREYERFKRTPEPGRCLDCHTEEFHAGFKQYLFGEKLTAMNKGGAR